MLNAFYYFFKVIFFFIVKTIKDTYLKIMLNSLAIEKIKKDYLKW